MLHYNVLLYETRLHYTKLLDKATTLRHPHKSTEFLESVERVNSLSNLPVPPVPSKPPSCGLQISSRPIRHPADCNQMALDSF